MVSYDLSAGVDDNCNAGEMEARVPGSFGSGSISTYSQALSLVLSAASAGFSIPFSTRHGPFLGTLFFAIGRRLSSHRGAFTCKPAIALLSGGFAILVIDLLFVRNQFGFMVVQPFLDTTFGVGCVLLALARPSLGAHTILPSLGRYVLVLLPSSTLLS